MHQFFNKLMCRRRVENVVLNGNVFIIELMKKSERGGVLRTRPKSCLAEFLGDDLKNWCTS
jgi:hypothetical protein